jgi:hypothetical protein
LSGVAFGPLEEVAAHAVLALDGADDGFDRRALAQVVFDRVGDTVPAGEVDLHFVVGRRIVAAVGDDAGKARVDLRLDLRDHGFKRVAVVGISGQRRDVGDELPALRAGEGGGDRHLDAELIGAMGPPIADAFDLRGVQRKKSPCPLFRRSFGRMRIAPAPLKRQSITPSKASSICKIAPLSTAQDSKIEYFQIPTNPQFQRVSESFTEDVNKIKHSRGIEIRYDKLFESFLAALKRVAIHI